WRFQRRWRYPMPLTHAERQEVMGSILFRDVPPAIIEKILSEQNTIVQNCRAGRTIFRGDEPKPDPGYLLAGYAVVRQAPTLYRDNDKDTYVNLVSPGGLFGVERWFIDRLDMTCVETLGPVRILRLHGEQLRYYAKSEA